MKKSLRIYISSEEINKLECLFDEFGPNYNEYVIYCKEKGQNPLPEYKFNSFIEIIIDCVFKKTNKHMESLYERLPHPKECSICKWVAEEKRTPL